MLHLVQLLTNAVMGVSLFLTRPFVPGDTVTLGGNVSGVVERVSPMRTTLLTDDGVVVTIPNKVCGGLRGLAGAGLDAHSVWVWVWVWVIWCVSKASEPAWYHFQAAKAGGRHERGYHGYYGQQGPHIPAGCGRHGCLQPLGKPRAEPPCPR